MTPSLAVVIVAFKSASTISACVTSCLRDPHVTQVVVVDNSNDYETSRIVEDLDRTHYLTADNVGFARGCNLGAAHTDEEWLAFVNPDVVFSRPLSDLLHSSGGGTWAAIAGRLSTAENGVNWRRRFSVLRELVAVSLGPSRTYSPPSCTDSWIRVGQLAGAFVLMHRTTFEQLNGFDERFELYYEDVDLAYRLEQIGGSWVLNEDFGAHSGGASSDHVPAMSYIVGKVSRVRFLRKWYPRAWPIAVATIAGLEWISRTLTTQSEGQRARNSALLAQLREAARPDSVRVLMQYSQEAPR